MKKRNDIHNLFVICTVLFGLSTTSQSATYTSTKQQLERAKITFNAALQCSQNYQQNKQRLECLSDHAAMRSKTKQKKLANWLSTIQVININHCNNTELQMAKKYKVPIRDIPYMMFCVRYYQKPFQKSALVTIGKADDSENWKIMAIKEF